MLRRAFLSFIQWDSLTLWRMQYEQMKREEAQRELDKKNEAAIKQREHLAALRNLIRVLNEDSRKLADPNLSDAPTEKRYREALERALRSTK